MSLAAERARAAERRWQERVERTARAALNGAGWSAGLKKVEAFIRERWPKLDDGQVEEVLARAGTMREERTNGARRLTPEEIENVATRKVTETKKAIRELLIQDPTMTSTEMWERCRARGVDLCAESSFAGYCTEARKDLGVSGKKAQRKGQAKGTAKQKHAAGRKPRPAGEAPWVSKETARQPSEEVSPPKDNAPPPAAPVADSRPNGVDQVRNAIETELLKAEQKVRELTIALDVLGRLAA